MGFNSAFKGLTDIGYSGNENVADCRNQLIMSLIVSSEEANRSAPCNVVSFLNNKRRQKSRNPIIINDRMTVIARPASLRKVRLEDGCLRRLLESHVCQEQTEVLLTKGQHRL